jgi:hypothetical protein
MLSDKLALSTLAGYRGKGIQKWRVFLEEERKWSAERLLSDDVVCLQGLEFTDERRIDLFILYIHHLQQGGVADVSIYCKALAYDFTMKGWFAVAQLLQSPMVMTARQHGERDQARAKAKARDGRVKQAVSGTMLVSLYEREWCVAKTSRDMKTIDRAAACLAGWLMVQTGLRVSNLLKTESDRRQLAGRTEAPGGGSKNPDHVVELDRHVMRAEDVLLKVEGKDGLITALEFSRRMGDAEVTFIVCSVVTSKSNQKGGRVVKFTLTKNSPGEARLVEMMMVFMKFAQYDSPQDMVFSRPQVARLRGTFGAPQEAAQDDGVRHRYQQDIVNEVVKECAARHGLDGQWFSTKSFKNCGISTAQAHRAESGSSETEVAARFDHKSVHSNRHYQRAEMAAPGPLSFLKSDGNLLYQHSNLVLLEEMRMAGAEEK